MQNGYPKQECTSYSLETTSTIKNTVVSAMDVRQRIVDFVSIAVIRRNLEDETGSDSALLTKNVLVPRKSYLLM